MIPRLSALFVLVSQGTLLLLVNDTSGATATAFSFLGHPAMVLGVALGVWAMNRDGGRDGRPDASAEPAGEPPGTDEPTQNR